MSSGENGTLTYRSLLTSLYSPNSFRNHSLRNGAWCGIDMSPYKIQKKMSIPVSFGRFTWYYSVLVALRYKADPCEEAHVQKPVLLGVGSSCCGCMSLTGHEKALLPIPKKKSSPARSPLGSCCCACLSGPTSHGRFTPPKSSEECSCAQATTCSCCV